MSIFKGPRRRMTLRLPGNLGRRIEALAKKAGLPLNEFINRELEKQVARDEAELKK